MRELISLLKEIKTLSFQTQNVSGFGFVTIIEEGSSLIFQEKGKWQETSFHNSIRWTMHEDTLFYEHLRYGKQRSVLLFPFEKVDENTFCCRAPFVCGKDCYQAHLFKEKEGVRLLWRVTGPQKNYLLQTVYSK